MKMKKITIISKSKLDKEKISGAKDLSKEEQDAIALKQEFTLKINKGTRQEFTEWE